MHCSRARSVLWPPEQLRVACEEVAQAQMHVRDCDGCQQYLLQDEALLDLYARVREIPAPMAVRQRGFDTLAATRWSAKGEDEESRGGSSTRGDTSTPIGMSIGERLLGNGPWPAAIAAVLAVVVLGSLHDVRVASEPSEVFVEDYLRRAVGQEHIESDDPREIRRFLERELGLGMEPLSLDGFDLARAEICLLEGRRGAMIVYKSDEGDVSHYLVPREDAPARAPTISAGTRGESMPVVTWASPNVEQALVAEIEPDELLRLAMGGVR